MNKFIPGVAFPTTYGDEIAVIPDLPMAKYADDKAWGDVVTSSTFLPRVQLFGGNSDPVKEGKIGIGRYGLVRQKDQIDDLTNQLICFPFSFRFKAMRIPGDGTVLSYFNPKSPEFLKIQDDSEKPDSGCMYGPEFLVWLPDQKVFATFFFSSKTARRESPNLRVLMAEKKAATVRSTLIKKGKHSWHGPVVTPCTTPITMPDMDELRNVAERFANPKDSEVETADGAGGDQGGENARPQ